MRVTLLQRGGYAVQGRGSYDPRQNAIVLNLGEDESRAIVLDYQAAPTSTSKEENSLTCSSLTTSGNTLSFTITDAQDGAELIIQATVNSEVTRTRFLINQTEGRRDGYGTA